jgi:PAS domain S-box-containing protein
VKSGISTFDEMRVSLDRLREGILVFDKKLKLTYINEYAANLQNLDITLNPDKSLFASSLTSAYLKQEIETYEEYLEQEDNWISYRFYPERSGVTVLIEDISEFRRNEKMLISSESRIMTVLENLPEGILIAELESRRFIFANGTICKMTGFSKNELFNMAIYDIHYKEDQGIADKAFNSVESDITEIEEIRVLRKDGTNFMSHITSVKIKLGGIYCICGVFSDISGSIEVHQKVMEQLDELKRWHLATLGREMRIIELKKEVNELLKTAGVPPKYSNIN